MKLIKIPNWWKDNKQFKKGNCLDIMKMEGE